MSKIITKPLQLDDAELDRVLKERAKEAAWAKENKERRKRQALTALRSKKNHNVGDGDSETIPLHDGCFDTQSIATRTSATPSTRCATAATQVGARLTAANLMQHRVLNSDAKSAEQPQCQINQDMLDSCCPLNHVTKPESTSLPEGPNPAFEGTITSQRSSNVTKRSSHAASAGAVRVKGDGYEILRVLAARKKQQHNTKEKQEETQEAQRAAEREATINAVLFPPSQHQDLLESPPSNTAVFQSSPMSAIHLPASCSLPPLAPKTTQPASNVETSTSTRPPQQRPGTPKKQKKAELKAKVNCGRIKRKRARSVTFSEDIQFCVAEDDDHADDKDDELTSPSSSSNATKKDEKASSSSLAAEDTKPPRHTKTYVPKLPSIFESIKQKKDDVPLLPQLATAVPTTPNESPAAFLQNAPKLPMKKSSPAQTSSKPTEPPKPKLTRTLFGKVRKATSTTATTSSTQERQPPPRAKTAETASSAVQSFVTQPAQKPSSSTTTSPGGKIVSHGGGIGFDKDGNLQFFAPAVMQPPKELTRAHVEEVQRKEQEEEAEQRKPSFVDDDGLDEMLASASWEPRREPAPQPMAAPSSSEADRNPSSTPPSSNSVQRAGTASSASSSRAGSSRLLGGLAGGYASRLRAAQSVGPQFQLPPSPQSASAPEKENEAAIVDVEYRSSPRQDVRDESGSTTAPPSQRQFGEVRSLNTGWTWKEQQLMAAIAESNRKLGSLATRATDYEE